MLDCEKGNFVEYQIVRKLISKWSLQTNVRNFLIYVQNLEG